MNASQSKNRGLGVAVAGAVAVFALGGVAYATIPSADGVITTCYVKSGGTLRVIDASVTECRGSESMLTWSIAGVAGEDGADGAPGADGVSGYDLITNDRSLEGVTSSFGGLTVNCPAGTKVLGGGGAFVSTTGAPAATSGNVILSSAPKADSSGWTIFYNATTISTSLGSVRVYATCATVN